MMTDTGVQTLRSRANNSMANPLGNLNTDGNGQCLTCIYKVECDWCEDSGEGLASAGYQISVPAMDMPYVTYDGDSIEGDYFLGPYYACNWRGQVNCFTQSNSANCGGGSKWKCGDITMAIDSNGIPSAVILGYTFTHDVTIEGWELSEWTNSGSVTGVLVNAEEYLISRKAILWWYEGEDLKARYNVDFSIGEDGETITFANGNGDDFPITDTEGVHVRNKINCLEPMTVFYEFRQDLTDWTNDGDVTANVGAIAQFTVVAPWHLGLTRHLRWYNPDPPYELKTRSFVSILDYNSLTGIVTFGEGTGDAFPPTGTAVEAWMPKVEATIIPTASFREHSDDCGYLNNPYIGPGYGCSMYWPSGSCQPSGGTFVISGVSEEIDGEYDFEMVHCGGPCCALLELSEEDCIGESSFSCDYCWVNPNDDWNYLYIQFDEFVSDLVQRVYFYFPIDGGYFKIDTDLGHIRLPPGIMGQTFVYEFTYKGTEKYFFDLQDGQHSNGGMNWQGGSYPLTAWASKYYDLEGATITIAFNSQCGCP